MGRLIDADKLSADMYHEAFVKDSDMQKWDSGCWIRYKMFENVLKAQPAVQPERIKGHWIAITSWNNTYKCSVCGRLLVNITDGKNKVAKNYPYCHCGADMRGEEHETD